MKLALHIERLVLDGLPVGAHEGPLVQAAVEAELAQLFQAQSHLTSFGGSATLSHLQTGSVRFAHGARPAAMGQGIARAVYSAISDCASERVTPAGLSSSPGTATGSTKPQTSSSRGTSQ
jgi:hypothetical protein